MKFTKYFIPVMSAAFLLSGCSLLGKLGIGGNESVSKPKFEDKGSTVTKTEFVNGYQQEMEDAGLIYKSGKHYSSFVATAKGAEKTNYKGTMNGNKVSSSDEETNIQKMSYDANNQVAEFEVSESETEKASEVGYTVTGKESYKMTGNYQMGSNCVYYVDKTTKSYREYSMDYDYIEKNNWMDYILYSQMSGQFGTLSYYMYSENAEYYKKGSVYTIEIRNDDHQYADQYSDYDRSTTSTTTIQMSFSGNNVTMKYLYTSNRTVSYVKDDTKYGEYVAGDKTDTTYESYSTSEITFKSVTVKEVDLSKYTKK